jgi:hypothetical protein
VTAGSVGGGYFAGVRLTHLGRLTHLDLPHDALLLLIITAGIAIIVLGWRVIAYLDRCDQRRHETISRMHDQEGVYQKYKDSSSAYERRPMAAVPDGEQGLRRPRRSRPQAEMNGHGNLGPLDRRHQVVPGLQPGGDMADPGSGQPGIAGKSRHPAARALTDAQSADPKLQPRPGAGRARSRRRRS